MAKRRDKYGRFRGNGGIKAYKSNLKAGNRRQKPKRKTIRARIGGALVGIAKRTSGYNPSARKPVRTKVGGKVVDAQGKTYERLAGTAIFAVTPAKPKRKKKK